MRNAWLGGTALLLALVAGAASAHAPGDRVLARWFADGLWYPARVTDVAGREVTLKYDDDKVAIMDAADVRPLDWRAGARLQCDWQHRGAYFPGVVVSITGEEITFLYDDGYKETLPASRCRSGATPD